MMVTHSTMYLNESDRLILINQAVVSPQMYVEKHFSRYN